MGEVKMLVRVATFRQYSFQSLAGHCTNDSRSRRTTLPGLERGIFTGPSAVIESGEEAVRRRRGYAEQLATLGTALEIDSKSH